MNIPEFLHYVSLRLLMNKALQKALLPFGHDLNPDRWIFILGCYNSATTLLASILRRHPLVGGLPNEGAFLTDALPYPELFGWPRMWSQCLDKVRLENGLGGMSRAKRIKRQWSLWFPNRVPNLIEKSISNITRTHFLQEYFDPAYFIYIVRNGYVVSKGIQKKANYDRWNCPYKANGYPIELCAEQWKVSDEILEKDSNKLKRILYVQYEDLTNNTIETLKKITDFLGISPIPGEILEHEWSIHEMKSEIVNMNPAGLKRLNKEDFERIESVAGNVLKKYGYTPDI